MAAILPVAAIGQTAIGGVAGLAGPAGAAAAGAPAAGIPGAGLPGVATPAAGDSFLDGLGSAVRSLNTQLTSADASMADFASGGSADLHTVMLDMQEASIGLKVGIAVRDKLLEAYQDVMRLQI